MWPFIIMDKEAMFQQFYDQLENIKDDVGSADFRFYNLSHLPLLIKNTLEKSDICNECKANISIVEEIVTSLPDALSNQAERKNFEFRKNKIEYHLKKMHKMRFPGYFASLGSLIGILSGILTGIIFTLNKNLSLLNDFMFIALASGLLIGRGIGLLLDRKIFNNNLQL